MDVSPGPRWPTRADPSDEQPTPEWELDRLDRDAALNLTVNVADAVVIRPGDRVLVHMPDGLSAEQAHVMTEQWKCEMPDVQLVLLAGGTVVGVERAA